MSAPPRVKILLGWLVEQSKFASSKRPEEMRMQEPPSQLPAITLEINHISRP